MGPEVVLAAAGMFAVTNIDDMVVLAVLFGRAGGDRAGALGVVAGQYLGFGAIVVVAVLGALGAGLLPEDAVPYLGLLPVALGVRAAWESWRGGGDGDGDGDDAAVDAAGGAVGPLTVAAVTFANGGDNIGVYVPVFASAGAAATAVYVIVFLAGVAVLCGAAWYLASRPLVASALARWGHVVLPVVLIAIGVAVLVEGGAFGL
jgi:cadmium resistance protein CadD (predicted permease)